MTRCDRVGEAMRIGQVKDFTGVTKVMQTIRWNGDGDVADRVCIATRLGEECDLSHADLIKDGFFYLVDENIAEGHDNKMLQRWMRGEGPESLWLFWRRGNIKPVLFTYLGPLEPCQPFRLLDDPEGRCVKVWKFRLLCPEEAGRAWGGK